MSVDMFIGFGIGCLVGLFVATVFYAVRWNEQYERAVVAERQLDQATTDIDQLRAKFDPHSWLDSSDVAVNIAGRERLREKYPELVTPGTEVVKIEVEGDIPANPFTEGES